MAGTNSDFETPVSTYEASAVDKEGRPKRKKRRTNRQWSADESAEDSDSSKSDLEECDD